MKIFIGCFSVFTLALNIWAQDPPPWQVVYSASPYSDLQVIQNFGYALSLSSLTTFDLNDPTEPIITHRLELGWDHNDHRMVIEDTFAYLARGNLGIQIIDLSQPESPRLAGQFPTSSPAANLYVSGNRLYLLEDAPRVSVWDITQPEDPQPISSVELNGSQGDTIELAGDLLFVSMSDEFSTSPSQLAVISITNEERPLLLSEEQFDNRISDTHYEEGIFYIQGFSDQRDSPNPHPQVTIQTFELSDSGQLVELDNEVFLSYPGVNFQLENHKLYSYSKRKLHTFDVSNPNEIKWERETILNTGLGRGTRFGDFHLLAYDNSQHIQVIDSRTQPVIHKRAMQELVTTANHFVSEGNLLYLAGSPGLTTWDLSDPDRPLFVNQLDFLSQTREMALEDNSAWMVTYDGGLAQVDLRNIHQPELVGTTPAAFEISRYANNYFQTKGSLGFGFSHPAGTPSQLVIFDLSPGNPATQIAQLEIAPYHAIRGLEVLGSLLFVGTLDAMLIIDIEQPDQPKIIHQFPLNQCAQFTISTTTQQLFTVETDPANNLRYINSRDLSQPQQPSDPIATLAPIQNYPKSFFVNTRGLYYGAEGGIYLASLQTEQLVFNLLSDEFRDFNHLAEINGIPFVEFGGWHYLDLNQTSDGEKVLSLHNSRTSCLNIHGDYLYAGNDYNGLMVFDVSHPDQPRHINSVKLPIQIRDDIHIQGNQLWLSSSDTLYWFDLANPTQPQLVEQWPFANPNSRIDHVIQPFGDYLLIGDGGDLRVVDLTNPSSPVFGQLVDFDEYQIHDFRIRGQVLLASGEEYLLSYDISNIHEPQLLRVLSINVSPHFFPNLILNGDQLWLLGEASRLYDISDPTKPRYVRQFDIGGGTAYANENYSLFFDWDGSFGSLDIQNPFYSIRQQSNRTSGEQVQFAKDRLFVAAANSGLTVLELEAYDQPMVVNNNIHRVANDYLDVEENLLVTGRLDGMSVYDVSTPSEPELLSQPLRGTRISGLQLNQGIAYTVENGCLLAIDLNQPSQPQVTSRLTFAATETEIHHSAVENGLWVFSEDRERNNFHIFDVRNPQAPSHLWSGSLQELTPESEIVEWILHQDRLYASTRSSTTREANGWMIIDLTQMNNGPLVSFQSSEHLTPLFIQKNYLFGHDEVFKVFSIADLDDPQFQGQTQLFHQEPQRVTALRSTDSIWLSGSAGALPGEGPNELLELDLSDPLQPSIKQHWPETEYWHWGFMVDSVYYSDWNGNGLHLWQSCYSNSAWRVSSSRWGNGSSTVLDIVNQLNYPCAN